MKKKYGSESVLPYNEKEHKGAQISRMFDAIAQTYDLLNHTLSFGLDKGWRKKAIAFMRPFAPKAILDVATGTGDLAIQMGTAFDTASVVGCDISEGMMDVARQKTEKCDMQDRLSYEYQDCCRLTFEDNRFDIVSAAFGVRNFEDIEQGLREMHRVLKPGGHLVVLELSVPERFPMKQCYQLYSSFVIPTVGKLLSKEKSAYAYLPASIRVVPQGEVMRSLLENVGFHNAKTTTLTLGICSLYTAEK